MVEVIGYVASGLIVLSFAMTSVVKLRIVSFIGCITFVTYGLLIGAIPVVLSNGIIAVLNAWFLYQEFTRKDLAMVPIAPDAPFLTDFIGARIRDIQRLQPGFKLRNDSNAWLLNRDGLPTGVLVGHKDSDSFVVDLDYVTPAYRDSRMGHYVYGPGSKTLKELGVSQVVAAPGAPEHYRYLEAMGFTKHGDSYTKQL